MIRSISAGFILVHIVAPSQAQQNFSYTGSEQTYTVPACANTLTVDLYGAQGYTADPAVHQAGKGGRVQAQILVNPAEVLKIYVGGQGLVDVGGFNGGGNPGAGSAPGGGGGASDIRRGSNLGGRIVVAAGGAGAGAVYSQSSHGGNGGGLTGSVGFYSGSYSNTWCGSGGTQIAGGIAASSNGSQPGMLGTGGTGGTMGGGGGGGYYGGGGGSYGGGGGGSSYAHPESFNVMHSTGVRSGHGEVKIVSVGKGMPRSKSIQGPPLVCAGTVHKYKADAVPGATGYQWTVPAGAEILQGQGSDTLVVQFGDSSGKITVAAEGACGPGLPQSFPVTVKQWPVAKFFGPDSAVINELVMFTDSSRFANSWTWYYGTGDSSTTQWAAYTYPNAGAYTVTLIAGNGPCKDTASKTIHIRWHVGIERSVDDLIGSVRMVPHPATSQTNLLWDHIINLPIQINIKDMQGRVVQELGWRSLGPDRSLPLSLNLDPDGPYVLEIKHGRSIFHHIFLFRQDHH